jgi:Matrixin
MKTLFQRALAILCATAALAAHAGGPLNVCYGQAVKYAGAGTVALNYDLGNLGTRTKATADTLVTNAVALWTNVPTSTVTLTRGADLPVDVTTANYSTYLSNFNDGINPVVYDTDGSIIDLLLGTGAKSSVLGFAGSAWSDNGANCTYVEGRAVINGFLSVSDATLTTVLAHEMGHLIGLDHTQLDSFQGLATSNYPLMYPIAYRTSASLHEDDVAAISSLYPDTTVATAYGTLTGTFVTVTGTPVRGANIWAQSASGQTFSVVSDYLVQGTGFFKLLLTPGVYTLHAEAIDLSFTGGSSVGPYADDSTGASFQPPLYSGTTPMAGVTMSPTITVTAGCAGTVTFLLSGVGTVGGSCTSTPPAPSTMTSPTPGSTLSGSSATFTWTAGSQLAARYLLVGSSAGTGDYFSNHVDSVVSQMVTGLPTDGRTIYVHLQSYINNAWQGFDYTYTAFTAAAATKSVLITPTPGSTLTGSSATFGWSAGSGFTYRYLLVGTTPGGGDLFSNHVDSVMSQMVTGIPTDGRTIYVRLQSYINNAWQIDDETYMAANVAPPPSGQKSLLTSPTPGSTLAGSSATFGWSPGSGFTYRYLLVGTTLGGGDLFSNHVDMVTSQMVSGIPTDGRTIYVRLQSYINNAWQIDDETYVAANTGGSGGQMSMLTSPTPGSTFHGSTVTFAWTAGSGLTYRYLLVGTTPGGGDLFSNHVGSVMSQMVTGIPTDGRTIYVRLQSYINNAWQIESETYMSGP